MLSGLNFASLAGSSGLSSGFHRLMTKPLRWKLNGIVRKHPENSYSRNAIIPQGINWIEWQAPELIDSGISRYKYLEDIKAAKNFHNGLGRSIVALAHFLGF
jgi:hypothetical protein